MGQRAGRAGVGDRDRRAGPDVRAGRGPGAPAGRGAACLVPGGGRRGGLDIARRASPVRDTAPGACRLGQYTLEDKIGEGGMGIVFRARHAMLRRPTVVKLLPPERAGGVQPGSLRARGAADQPAVQPQHRRGLRLRPHARRASSTTRWSTWTASTWTSWSRSAGRSRPAASSTSWPRCAARWPRRTAPGWSTATSSRATSCCAARAACSTSSRSSTSAWSRTWPPATSSSTQADTFLGTPLYLSPEAITQPGAVDGRSDLYAVGGLGYFLLTGRPMFAGRTVAELCGKHLYEAPVPPSEIAPGVPRRPRGDPALVPGEVAGAPAAGRRARCGPSLLACADAGRWSDADAHAWWDSHPPSSRPDGAPARGDAPTMALPAAGGLDETRRERRLHAR